MSQKTLLLVDGNALLYRAFFAFPPLTSPTGAPIGAVYGFTRILLSTIRTLKPTHLAVAFDLPGPTLRHQQYEAYKATRQKMPEDLAAQIETMHRLVEHLEVPVLTKESYEADDVIGSLSVQQTAQHPDLTVIILTGDQDILQLVDERIKVYSPATPPKSPTLFTTEAVQAKYGFSPKQMVEFKALRGDPSDNIPGVTGVGEVTATKLIQEFGTLENLYKALHSGGHSVKGALLEKLQKDEAQARMSHQLATICTDLELDIELEQARLELKHPEALVAYFEELGFKSLIPELPVSQRLQAQAAEVFAEAPVEASLETSAGINKLLESVLRKMEERGVKVDLSYLKKLEAEFEGDIAKFKQQLIDLSGQEFNPDSPSQIAQVFYEVLKIPTDRVRKGKTGYTTDAATMTDLAEQYPIAQVLLNYRELTKLQNTYVKPLQELADEHSRIHTSYAPDAATGRISSRNPNLQNIPVRTEQGKRLRQAFVADKGKILLGADYSQLELRIAAHLADDPVMKAAFKAGKDFHAETGALMGVDRRVAKVINFSILFGKGAFGFAKDLGITVAEAKLYIEKYFQTYPKLKEYLDGVLELGRKQGYLETMFGTRRELPELNSANFQHRAAAEREAMNLPIQGTEADILKRAMCQLEPALETACPKTQLILTVHDELVLETVASELQTAAKVLCEVMTQTTELSVPLEVNLKKGQNWAEMEEFDLS